MSIDFACKCGKQLRAQEDHAGKRVQCPGCGRIVEIPGPAGSAPRSEWLIDESDEAGRKAEKAGVVRAALAHVIRLHGPGELEANLCIRGVLTCWYCRTDIPFTGRVFGRSGLAGEFVAVSCPQCHAKLWTGFSTHLRGDGTDVFLYAPSHARQYTRSEKDRLPIPTFSVREVVEEAPPEASTESDERVDQALSSLVQVISRRASYQSVSAQAAELVNRPLTREQCQTLCRTLRALLEKENTTHFRAVLAEALAALRDERAAGTVQAAIARALKQDDPADPSNLPLHDLCVLGLLYGNRKVFEEAMRRGMKDLAITTRAVKLDRRLSPQEVAQLLQNDQQIDSYEGVLGGARWQRIQPLLPMWDEGARKGWLQKLFGREK
jgi:hypothetical protein